MTLRRTGFKPPTPEKLKEAQERKYAKAVAKQAATRLKVVEKKPKATKLGKSLQNSLKVANLPKKRKAKSPLKKLKEQLWQLCREITIKRDGSDCYTCPSKDLSGSSRHLGHFISSSVCSVELRYALDNLRIQCYSCNIHKSGNWLAFENRLTKEHGEDYVRNLKQRNEETKNLMYRDDFYIQKIEQYKAILAAL